jgi:tetratricopeptide (TPR) repeat protein
MNQKQFEEIEQYLTGRMKSEERAAFEKRLASDASLKKEVETYKFLIDGVQEKALREEMETFHREVEQKNSASNPPVRRLGGFARVALAASVIVLFGIGFWMIRSQVSSDTRLFNEHFLPDPGLMTPMSTTSNYEFFRGMVDYKQEKYKAAILRWESLLKQKPENDTLTYYLGVAWLAEGDASKAIYYLEKPFIQQSIFGSDRNFYLGLAYLKNNQPEKAKEALYRSGLTNNHPLIQALE